ncbi:MAG: immunity 26/phosphotriesterase HocA family protein [Nitrospira sp.]|nr:immunity 26/phosphotriesterase HocA family protein [Nitrospira sp.]
MARRKINYSEGTCFAAPLRKGGFARGVVARMDGQGIVFGYFFGPQLSSMEETQVTSELQSERAILCGRFGDLGLLKGEWKIIGAIPE